MDIIGIIAYVFAGAAALYGVLSILTALHFDPESKEAAKFTRISGASVVVSVALFIITFLCLGGFR